MSLIPKLLRTLERGADAKVPEMESQELGDVAEPLAQHEHPLLLKAALSARWMPDAFFRSWDTGVPKAGIKTRRRFTVASRSVPAPRQFRPIYPWPNSLNSPKTKLLERRDEPQA